MPTKIPIGTVFFAWCTFVAVVPIRRPHRLAMLSWISSAVPNELPFLFLAIVVGSNLPSVLDGDHPGTGGWISLALVLLTTAGLVVIAARALRAKASLDVAMAAALGATWRTAIDPGLAVRLRRRRPWLRILFVPWTFGRHDVRRTADVPYGPNGTDNLLDVYRHRSGPVGAPTLVYLHGGHFTWGRKSREARPLLYHLASQGWTCISANYHLSRTPAEGFPEHLVDVKRVIAWVRSHGHEHGADPGTIVLVGASSGAHLTAMAALTADDSTFQPGFEGADTSITAAVGMYGYYGPLGGDEHLPTTPLGYPSSQAPPFLVVHGANDTYTPVEGAGALVEHVRAGSSQPVVFAELPGAQHSFDLFSSIRFEAVVDAIEAFAAWVRSGPR